jgi:hypothetical protein
MIVTVMMTAVLMMGVPDLLEGEGELLDIMAMSMIMNMEKETIVALGRAM